MAIFDEAMLITAESLSPELSGDCFSILGHAPGLFLSIIGPREVRATSGANIGRPLF